MKNNKALKLDEGPDPSPMTEAPVARTKRKIQSVSESLEMIYAYDLEEFRFHLAEIDWTTGNTKHEQMRSAFGSAASRGIRQEDAEELISKKIHDCGGLFDERSFQRFRDFAYNNDQGERPRHTSSPGQPRVNHDPEFTGKIVKAAGNVDGEELLRKHSPVDPSNADLKCFFDSLYLPSEGVLVFELLEGQGDCLYEVGTRIPDSLPLQAEEGIFFLTNPVDGFFHPNRRENGKLSRRSAEAITAYRYLLIESDNVPVEDWLRILIQLPLPIAAVTLSGGKSVHALVRVEADSKSDYDEGRRRLRPILGALGVDLQATSAVHLSRLPTAYRGEVQQKLLYLNSLPETKPILELAEQR